MKKYIFISLFLNGLTQVFGQNERVDFAQPLDGQLIVQTVAGISPDDLRANWEAAFPRESTGGDRFVFHEIALSMHIWLVDFDESFIKKNDLRSVALKTPGVATAQFNYQTEERTKEPNDPQYFKQTDLDLIRAAMAWDASTGGLTPQGDTIVIAVLEKGIYRNHPDLWQNMYKNWKEIPGNGIDDDENGSVDDFAGWDVRNNTDGMGTVSPHGVSVCGIIGARGDNSAGVTGVNWRVKIMPVVNCSLTSEIIAAYEYVLKQRKLYNQTNGQKGAFVVATNASFGISGLFPASQPIWCGLYDSLGVAGVLSVGATDNANINVDIAGDLPSTCPSEYLVIVTNVGQNDVKVNGAAYGPVNVDLGAPGEACWTTDFRVPSPPSTDTTFYNAFPGTSAATPHVTGTIGWMYSLPCDQLASDSKTNPSGCAKRMRDLLLKNVEPNTSLKDLTTTKGRLDMFNILTASRALCGGTVGTLEITEITVSPGYEKIIVNYQTPDFIPYTVLLVDKLGRILQEKRITPDQFLEKTFEFENTNTLANGVYAVAIQNRNGVAAKQFVKF